MPEATRSITPLALASDRILNTLSRTSGAFDLDSITTKPARSAAATAASASGNQHAARLRQAVEQAGEGEGGDAREEEPLAPDEVTGAPAEQQEAAEHERVGVHDPLEAAGGEVEVLLDRRQRDVHDGRVEN